MKPIDTGKKDLYAQEESYLQISAGQHEDFNVALTNIYKAFIGALSKLKENRLPDEADMDFPCVEMGLDGVKFINKCVDSSTSGAIWVDY